MPSPTVIVLGGGLGGVVAARRIRSLAPEARVVLIERQALQAFPPSYTWVMTGERTTASITRDLRRLSRKGIEVMEANVERIDPAARTVTANGKPIAFDFLVIALGAELAPDAIPGLAEEAHTYYTADEAQRLHEALNRFDGGRVAVLIPSLPYKCPAAPYEGALLLDTLFRKRGIRDRVEISLSTPEPQPLPVAGSAPGSAVAAMLADRGIAYHPKRRTSAIDRERREIVFEDGEREPYDLLIAIPPHRPPKVVADTGLTGPSGWVQVDRGSLATAAPRIFAIGDVTMIPLFDGLPLPKAGVFAHAQAEVVARNIAAEIKGTAERRQFDGHGYCFLESGGGRAGSASGEFYAEPRTVTMKDPTRWRRTGKQLFERWWLWRWY